MKGRVERSYEPGFRPWQDQVGAQDGVVSKWSLSAVGPNSNVVYHPSLRFDPFSADVRQADILERIDEPGEMREISNPYVPRTGKIREICHEQVRLNTSISKALEPFIRITEDLLHLGEDEWLWDDTGFWTATLGRDRFFGVAEEGLRALLDEEDRYRTTYVLANAGEICTFSSDGYRNEKCSLDVYLTNHYGPFNEARKRIHKALSSIGNWSTVSLETGPDSLILGKPESRRASRGVWSRESFAIEPVAVIRVWSGCYHGALIRRPTLLQLPDGLRGQSHLLVTLRGSYWFNEDLTGQDRYRLFLVDSYVLRTCVLIDAMLEKVSRHEPEWMQLSTRLSLAGDELG